MSESKKKHLEQYLFEPKNSHAKESLINNRLFYDLKLAAIKRGYFLNLYLPEVDKDGFDIILDDQDSLTKLQVKTVMKGASTRGWKIHKSLLRPNHLNCEKLGFELSPTGTGYQGGVILIEIHAEDGFNVDYYYTDIFILIGILEKILDLTSPPKSKVIKKLFENLGSGSSQEKVFVSKKMFIKAKNPIDLLALIGLHNTATTFDWHWHIKEIISSRNNKELSDSCEKSKKLINFEIAEISNGSIKTTAS